MADPADSVIEDLRGREGLVTALMGKNPQTGTEETLHEGVNSPETSSDGSVGDIFGSEITVCEVKCHSQRDDVSSDIVQTRCGRSFEAVLWDGFVNVIDRVIWDLELVAVSIDQFLGSLLLLSGGDFGVAGKRREGGGGGRVSRTICGRNIGRGGGSRTDCVARGKAPQGWR